MGFMRRFEFALKAKVHPRAVVRLVDQDFDGFDDALEVLTSRGKIDDRATQALAELAEVMPSKAGRIMDALVSYDTGNVSIRAMYDVAKNHPELIQHAFDASLRRNTVSSAYEIQSSVLSESTGRTHRPFYDPHPAAGAALDALAKLTRGQNTAHLCIAAIVDNNPDQASHALDIFEKRPAADVTERIIELRQTVGTSLDTRMVQMCADNKVENAPTLLSAIGARTKDPVLLDRIFDMLKANPDAGADKALGAIALEARKSDPLGRQSRVVDALMGRGTPAAEEGLLAIAEKTRPAQRLDLLVKLSTKFSTLAGQSVPDIADSIFTPQTLGREFKRTGDVALLNEALTRATDAKAPLPVRQMAKKLEEAKLLFASGM